MQVYQERQGGSGEPNYPLVSNDQKMNGSHLSPLSYTPRDIHDMIDFHAPVAAGNNPNIVPVTNETQFVGANKIFSIVGTFALSQNLVLPDGAILINGGGKMTVGAFDINGTNLSFYSNVSKAFIDLGQNGTINNAATFSEGNINLIWFGAVGDGDTITGTGTDNRNVFMQAKKIFNKAQGKAYIDIKGEYLYSVVPSSLYAYQQPTNFHSEYNASFSTLNGARIGALPNDLNYYDIFTIYKPQDVETVLHVIGDMRNHTFTNPTSSNCHGIIVQGGGNGLKLSGSSTEVSGSCLHGKYHAEFAYVGTFIEDYYTKDFDLNIADGTTSANTEFAYSNRTDISSSLFTSTGNLSFGGSSSGGAGGNGGMKVQKFKVAFYDNTSVDGDTTTGFLTMTDWVDTYKTIPIPTGATSARIVIYTPDDWSQLTGSLTAISHLENMVLGNFKASWGRYHLISNMPRSLQVNGNVSLSYGGQGFDGAIGETGLNWNTEDGFEFLSYQDLSGITSWNGTSGRLTFRYQRGVNIHDCKFLQSTDSRFEGEAIDLETTYDCKFYANIVETGYISLGTRMQLFGNTLSDLYFAIGLRDEKLYNNRNAKNIQFRMQNVLGAKKATIAGNEFIYPKPLENAYIFFGVDKGIDWIDNVFDFYGQNWNTTTKKLSVSYSGQTAPNKNVWNDNKIINLVTPVGVSGGEGLQQPAYKEVKRNVFECSVKVIGGQSQDITWEKNERIGWVNFLLSDFPATDAGTFPTITMKDEKILINDYNYLNQSSSRMLRLPAKDVNFYAENCVFEFDDPTAPFGEEDRFFAFNNYGTKILKNCTFKSSIPATQDLSGANVTGQQLLLINPTFDGYNVSALRATDKIVYTYPSANCPVYANNAAAIADGYPVGYYYKDSSNSNKFEITH